MALSLRCRRYLVLSYTVILAISGVSLMVMGSWLIYLYASHYSLALSSIGWGPMGSVIVCGALSIALSCVGWRGANKRKPWIILTFTGLLILMIAGLFAICVVALVKRESIPVGFGTVEQSFSKSMQGEAPHAKYWEKVQNELECCGVNGPTDYRSSNGVPWACCSTQGNVFAGSCMVVFQRGCLDVLINDVRRLLVYTSLIALGGALVQSLGLFCSIQLAIKLRKLAKIPSVVFKAPLPMTGPQSKALLNGVNIPTAKV